MMDLRYPIGQFTYEGNPTRDLIENWIKEIENLPAKLKEAIKDLQDEQLNTSYRPGGWTVRQVVHHIADSHMNSYIRFKLALTENNPTIKPYMEEKWAELPDSQLPIDVSLALLESLHMRWVTLLRSMKSNDFEKTFHHPESGSSKLGVTIGLYAWHGRHHTAHITSLRDRLGW
ncbi:YfiT family bacillithiol transferase [Bacillus sp. S13(2024)]|uniref:YfiT family bacillithiol transferase n=1 Tax=unclassified Bacillus (in: firmicutes) TaxID=185979 RepID=UPI003D1BD07F